MTVIKALILGIIAGIADFIPVSASGHIALFSHFMGVEGEIDLMFIIVVHIGTLISVILVYYSPVIRCIREFIGILCDAFTNLTVVFTRTPGGEKKYRRILTNPYRKIVIMLLIAMIPTIIFGILVTGLSESLIGNTLASGIGLFISGLLLLVASFSGKAHKGPHEAKYFDAFLVGAFQGFAGFPGISRIGMTASSSFLSGFTPKLAVLFSLLLSIPTVIGSFVFEAIRMRSAIPAMGAGYSAIAMVSAAIVGYFALTFLRRLIAPRFTRIFAVYCAVIAIVSIIVYLV